VLMSVRNNSREPVSDRFDPTASSGVLGKSCHVDSFLANGGRRMVAWVSYRSSLRESSSLRRSLWLLRLPPMNEEKALDPDAVLAQRGVAASNMTQMI
jgi:hypothetical protein